MSSLLLEGFERIFGTGAPVEPVTLNDLMIRVIDKDTGEGRLINLGENLTPVQIQALDLWCPLWKSGDSTLKPGLREDILKARQEGMSTLIIALIFLNTYNQRLTYSIIMAHDADSTEKLFEIVKRFFQHLPTSKKRKPKYSNRRELVWLDTDSGIYVLHAGRENAGRSGSWTYVLMSERAKWKVSPPGARELEGGILGAVPRSGCAWKETTAHGINDYFDDRKTAHDGKSSFTPRFFPWYEHPGYRMWPPDPKDLPWVFTEKEERLSGLFPIGKEQWAWYRWKAREQGDQMPQEFPTTEEEAFISTGNRYYNAVYLLSLLEGLEHPIEVRDRDTGYMGTLEIYEYPEKGVRYVAGIDCAKGTDKESNERDYTTIDIARTDTWAQVASYWGQPPYESFGHLVDVVGREFNNCFLVIENDARGYGQRVIDTLRELDYPEIYYHKLPSLVAGDKSVRLEAGYPARTHEKTNRNNGLQQAIEDAASGYDTIKIRAKRAIGELLRIVDKGNGDVCGEGSSKDDHNTSVGLLVYGLTLMGRPMPKVEVDRWAEQEEDEAGRVIYGGTSKLAKWRGR